MKTARFVILAIMSLVSVFAGLMLFFGIGLVLSGPFNFMTILIVSILSGGSIAIAAVVCVWGIRILERLKRKGS